MPNSKKAEKLFSGRRAKWLPLYRRFVARITRLTTLELKALSDSIQLGSIGKLRATQDGIELGFNLKGSEVKSRRLALVPRAKKTTRGPTHFLVITEPSQIDDELISWVRVALAQARNAKRRPT